MPNREKVINAIDICLGHGKCDDCGYRIKGDYGTMDCRKTMMRDALALLKEQEPMKPVIDIGTWKCGNCGHTLEHQELLGDNVLFHEQYNYCPTCGRAVKWNERH